MHKKIPKICTGCRVSAAKIYLYHSTKIAKARPHSEEWQTDTSVQKQWSMSYQLCTYYLNVIFNLAYQTRDIISRGLYILDPLFEGQFHLSKGLFS